MGDYSDPEKIAALAKIDPELEQILDAHPPPKPDWADINTLREMRRQMEAARQANPEEAKFESTKLIPMRDGYQSEIRIHRPENPPAKSALVVLLFGGGFVMGSNIQLSVFARAIAKILGATAVTLSYRLAPEHKFPAQAYDAWDSIKWLAENAASIGADPSAGFVVGGVSAGGNLTAHVVQKAVSEGLKPAITGAWLCIPVLLSDAIVPEKYKARFFSRVQNDQAPIFNGDAIRNVDKYMEADEKSPLWSPFNVPGAHTGFPPSYFQVCGMDPLRDDGLIYEAVLREHGVKTKLDVYPGVPHGHFSYMPMLKQSKKAIVDVLKGMGWLLGKEVSDEDAAGAVAPPPGA